MKKIIWLFGILAFITLSSSMCEKEDDSSYNNNVSSLIQNGTWKVTYYNDNGTDETNKFAAYTFSFNSNGSVTAASNSSTVSGSWSEGSDDSLEKLYLTFTVPPFDEIADDWHITEQSSAKIKLEDVSGGNGGTDYLTFEKF